MIGLLAPLQVDHLIAQLQRLGISYQLEPAPTNLVSPEKDLFGNPVSKPTLVVEVSRKDFEAHSELFKDYDFRSPSDMKGEAWELQEADGRDDQNQPAEQIKFYLSIVRSLMLTFWLILIIYNWTAKPPAGSLTYSIQGLLVWVVIGLWLAQVAIWGRNRRNKERSNS